jgi:outer membrane protein OmpA-like peptidoglycan-associated protein
MQASSSSLARILTLGLAAVLVACASPPPSPPRSYVVLLPSPDGSVGQVSIQGNRGEQILSVAQQGAALDGSTPPYDVSPEQLARDFGAARGAQPVLPEQFLLYFEIGGAELTAESKASLAVILARSRVRTAVDVSVIGHTDTLGKADINEGLALKRAAAIAEQLRQAGLQNLVLTVESHGERNLLVPTPDETAEPRNRRVEVTLR